MHVEFGSAILPLAWATRETHMATTPPAWSVGCLPIDLRIFVLVYLPARTVSSSSVRLASPREFKQTHQRFGPQFIDHQQQDSQGLVAFLLDGLHEDLNRILKKQYFRNPDLEGGGNKELVELVNVLWEGYLG
jgi:hypothetical protein